MITFLIITAILMVIHYLFFKEKSKKVFSFELVFTLFLLTLLFNLVYFIVNYDDLKIESTKRIVSITNFDKEKMVIETKVADYELKDIIESKIDKSNNIDVVLNDSSYVVLKNKVFVGDLTGFAIIMPVYVSDKNTTIINLNKKDYALYKAFEANVKKGKSSL